MPCEPFKWLTPSGKVGHGIVCSRGRIKAKPKCCLCGDAADYLCDGKREDGRTCDNPICSVCRVHVGKNRDLCPGCAAV